MNFPELTNTQKLKALIATREKINFLRGYDSYLCLIIGYEIKSMYSHIKDCYFTDKETTDIYVPELLKFKPPGKKFSEAWWSDSSEGMSERVKVLDQLIAIYENYVKHEAQTKHPHL